MFAITGSPNSSCDELCRAAAKPCTQDAQQEIAALVMAASLIARERLAVAAAAGGEVQAAGAVRISMRICLEHQCSVAGAQRRAGTHGETAQIDLVRRMQAQIAACALPPRRAQSCARKVRQPVTKWPRMISPIAVSSPAAYEVIKIA